MLFVVGCMKSISGLLVFSVKGASVLPAVIKFTARNTWTSSVDHTSDFAGEVRVVSKGFHTIMCPLLWQQFRRIKVLFFFCFVFFNLVELLELGN